jgi:hypothetical protein
MFKVDKKLLSDNFKSNLNENFSKYSKYFDFQLWVFTEFNTLIFEINKCQILEFHRATITLTNNLLERLLKLALIYNTTGIGGIPIEKWNSVFDEPTEKYGSLSLGNSIEKCKKEGLINAKEKDFLFNIIRELMRNGFSHADSSKILADLPDEIDLFQGSFFNPDNVERKSVKQKNIPFLQAIHLENFAKANSNYYFDFVFNLIFRIEDRLKKKYP